MHIATHSSLNECVNESGNAVPCSEGFAPLYQLTVVFGNVAGVVLTLAGFSVVIMLIVGGFRYISARGDPKALQSARGTITWAIVGLVFIILAFLIVDFLAGFIGIPELGKFCVPGPGADCPYRLEP